MNLEDELISALGGTYKAARARVGTLLLIWRLGDILKTIKDHPTENDVSLR